MTPEAEEIQASEVVQRIADAFRQVEPEKPAIQIHYIPSNEEKQATHYDKVDALLDELDLGESKPEPMIPLTYQEAIAWRWQSTLYGKQFAIFENPKNSKQKTIVDHKSRTVEVFIDDTEIFLNSQRGRDIVLSVGLVDESDF